MISVFQNINFTKDDAQSSLERHIKQINSKMLKRDAQETNFCLQLSVKPCVSHLAETSCNKIFIAQDISVSATTTGHTNCYHMQYSLTDIKIASLVAPELPNEKFTTECKARVL